MIFAADRFFLQTRVAPGRPFGKATASILPVLAILILPAGRLW
jgi:hypothetical protein